MARRRPGGSILKWSARRHLTVGRRRRFAVREPGAPCTGRRWSRSCSETETRVCAHSNLRRQNFVPECQTALGEYADRHAHVLLRVQEGDGLYLAPRRRPGCARIQICGVKTLCPNVRPPVCSVPSGAVCIKHHCKDLFNDNDDDKSQWRIHKERMIFTMTMSTYERQFKHCRATVLVFYIFTETLEVSIAETSKKVDCRSKASNIGTKSPW